MIAPLIEMGNNRKDSWGKAKSGPENSIVSSVDIYHFTP